MPVRPVLMVATLATVALAMAPGAPAAPAPAPVVVTGERSGDTVTLARGRTLELRLTACLASCGYRYETRRSPDPRVLRFVSSRIQADPQPAGEPPVVGGSSTKVVRYRAAGRGTTRLALRLVSPGGTTDGTFRLTVRVR